MDSKWESTAVSRKRSPYTGCSTTRPSPIEVGTTHSARELQIGSKGRHCKELSCVTQGATASESGCEVDKAVSTILILAGRNMESTGGGDTEEPWIIPQGDSYEFVHELLAAAVSKLGAAGTELSLLELAV